MPNENRTYSSVLSNIKKTASKVMSAHPLRKLEARYASRLEHEGIEDCAARRASIRARSISIISFLLLLVLIVCAFAFGNESISLSGVYYMYREVDAMGDAGVGENRRLDYSIPVKNQDLALFKNGLCVASDAELQVFNKNGYQTLGVSLSYTDPKVLAFRDRILVYDLGGRGFCLYNSFTDLYSESREYPISAAAVSDSGIFAIVGKSQSYNCEVTVYGEDMQKMFSYSRNDYAVSCDIDAKGKHLALATLTSNGGSAASYVTVVDIKKQEAVANVKVPSAVYECRYIERGRLACICSDRVVIYDTDLDVCGEYLYDMGELFSASCDIDGDGVVLMFSTDKTKKKYTAVYLNSKGKIKLEYGYTGDVSDIKAYDGYVFIADKTGVLRIDTDNSNEKTAQIESDGGKIIVCGKDKVILARRSVADVVDTFK